MVMPKFFARTRDDLSLVYSLVRRDYALQYAGMALGLVWLLIQYAFQVALFFVIFGLLLGTERHAVADPAAPDYLLYLLGGMVLWLPLAEMLLRGCGILAENRQIIRRTTVGARLLLRVPVAEAVFHYAILFACVCCAGALRGADIIQPGLLLAFALGTGALLFCGGWSFLLARVGIIFKDVSPLMRLGLQILFWSTPVVYAVPPAFRAYFAYHPLHVLFTWHRHWLFGIEAEAFPWLNGLVLFALFSLPVFVVSAFRLDRVATDQL